MFAAGRAVEDSASVVLYHGLTLRVPHAVSILLLEHKMAYMSPARHLSCMNILLNMPNLTIERCTTLNPSTLIPIATDGCTHDCVAEMEKVVLHRPDLTDLPLPDAEITMFVDGSSRKNPDGSNATGYAVVTHTEVLEAEALPKNYSAQQAEIVALTRACELG